MARTQPRTGRQPAARCRRCAAKTTPTQRDQHIKGNWSALVEANIARWKRLSGGALRSLTDGRQATELAIVADVVELGRPEDIRIV